MPSPGNEAPPTAAPTELVVDVDAMRRAIAAARPAGQVVALTPDQLETLLLVVDENARLLSELERAKTMLQGVVSVIDEVLEVGLQGNPVSVPPPAQLAADGDAPDPMDPIGRRPSSRAFFDGEDEPGLEK